MYLYYTYELHMKKRRPETLNLATFRRKNEGLTSLVLVVDFPGFRVAL
jgi:hypothetical protein